MYLVHVDSTIRPPSPLVDLRGLFVNLPSPPSGPHGLRMTPKLKHFDHEIWNASYFVMETFGWSASFFSTQTLFVF